MSNINNITSGYQQAYINTTQKNKNINTNNQQTNTTNSATQDKVSFSDVMQDIQLAKTTAYKTQTPEAKEDVELRANKIEQYKQAYNEGTYSVDAEKIAEKMLGNNIDSIL